MQKSRQRPSAKSRRAKLEADVREGMEAQRVAFEMKFGRPPGPGDPIFFDPGADEPTPMPQERMDAEVVNAMLQADLPRHLVFLYIRTGGMVVDRAAYGRLSADDKKRWDSAVGEYEQLAGEEIGGGFYLHNHDAPAGTGRSGGWMTPIGGDGTPWFQIDGEEACEFAFTDKPTLQRIVGKLVDAAAWFMVVPGEHAGEEFPSLLVQIASAPLVEAELDGLEGGYISRGPHNAGKDVEF